MNQIEQSKNASDFARFWADKGNEKQECQRFWIDLLQNVLGVGNPAKYIEFEKPVKLTHTSFIDAYIAGTKVLIEQKGSDIDLHKAYRQSDGAVLSPYQQAKRYVGEMKASEKPRWIVVCNFTEFLIYDLEVPNGEPQQIFLKDLPNEYYRLQFLVDQKNENIRREEELSFAAGKLVDKLYEALLPQYKGQDEKSLRSLNILCVRIVFCLYAEDAGLFDTRTAFEDYIKGFNLPNVRMGLMNLFKALDTPLEGRDTYDESLKPFPYVNGGLFKDENIEIPGFTQEIVDVIVNDCAPFNWSEISPTIFGAVFESTLNPETRRRGGMHYTSIQNIHKVIDPLFMDDLKAEFDAICQIKTTKQKMEKLLAFQEKLGSLTFLDPACGSGNFLTETYLSLRRLENEVIKLRYGGQNLMGVFEDPVKVHISQFYGIEINDFAVTVAKTALWIAESQMIAETEAIISQNIDFLPLKTRANIVEGNALRLDWATLAEKEGTGFLFADKLNVYKIDEHHGKIEVHSPAAETADGPLEGKHFKELNVITKEVEEKKLPETNAAPVVYDYIIGNPPFSGARIMLKESEQKKDIADTFSGVKAAGNLDYVCCWYKKAADYMRGKKTRAALVSTNSICQGEHVAVLWKLIFGMGIQIDFAYRTFRWYSESSDMAHVHCVIVGFSGRESGQRQKFIFDESGNRRNVSNINGYLMDLPDVFIESRKQPLCIQSKTMIFGNTPIDNGNLIIEAEELEHFLKKEPNAKRWIYELTGSREFINGLKRYCLWLENASPSELRKMPEIMQRIDAVKTFRQNSNREATRKLADTPWLFGEIRQSKTDYLLIPLTSSEKRRYIPIGFVSKNIIATNLVQMLPDATLYDFGILTSNISNAWMRAVGGKLKSDYRYTITNVYNNFPWCNPTEEQKHKIEETAQAILDARASHANDSLADLYDEKVMPADLRAAHRENDKAVMAAYGFGMKMTESECVAELFKLYEKLTKL